MTTFVGCEPGLRYGFSASLNGKEVRLDLSEVGCVAGVAKVSSHLTMLEDGALLRVWNRIPLKGDLLVLWHLDAPETFHGFYDPVEFAETPRPSWIGYGVEHCRLNCCQPITPVGSVVEAESDAAQAVAAVVEIPVSGLLYVTAGRYGSRKWMVHTVTVAGETRESLKDYRARVLKAEGV